MSCDSIGNRLLGLAIPAFFRCAAVEAPASAADVTAALTSALGTMRSLSIVSWLVLLLAFDWLLLLYGFFCGRSVGGAVWVGGSASDHSRTV